MASINPPNPHQTKSTTVSGTTIAIIVVVSIVLILGGIVIGTATSSLLPVQASAEAPQIDNLFQVLLVIGGVVFLLVQGLLVYSIWRFRAKKGDTSDGINMHGNTTLEIVWTAIPAVVVFVLTVLSWQVYNSIMSPKVGELSIRANGARFNWNFEYEMPISIMGKEYDISLLPPTVQEDLKDDNLITLTSATLYLTKDQPVVMQMEPKDVIHAFWIPAFRVKQDLIPGRVTTVRFTPTLAGEYLIECAELCGANHGAMRAPVVVVDNQSEMDAVLMPIMQKLVEPPADPALRGRALLESNVYPCYTCHNLADLASANWVGNVGPALSGVADRAATTRSTATGQSPQEYLYNAIHEPAAYLVPGYGALMPQLGIPECQVWDMVAYLATQSESGEAPFEVTIPDQCQVQGPAGGPPPAEATPEIAEATAEATSENPAGEAAIEQIGGAPAEATADPAVVEEATAEATVAP